MSINIVENGELKNISGINFDELSAVAKTGSYNDLLNKPNIPAKATDIGAAIGDASGVATSAAKLNINAGSATKPVYFANGVPVAGSYTLGGACAKGVATTVASGNTNLVTSGAVYTALQSTGGASVEEGTWTPNNSQLTWSNCTYVKIGKLCFLRATGANNSSSEKSIASGTYITGLPFNVKRVSSLCSIKTVPSSQIPADSTIYALIRPSWTSQQVSGIVCNAFKVAGYYRAEFTGIYEVA